MMTYLPRSFPTKRGGAGRNPQITADASKIPHTAHSPAANGPEPRPTVAVLLCNNMADAVSEGSKEESHDEMLTKVSPTTAEYTAGVTYRGDMVT